MPAGKGFAEAVKHLARGCDVEPKQGCFPLALVRARGWGAPKDMTKAHELARKACQDGDKDACAWLRNPREVPKWVEIRDAEEAKAKKSGGARP